MKKIGVLFLTSETTYYNIIQVWKCLTKIFLSSGMRVIIYNNVSTMDSKIWIKIVCCKFNLLRDAFYIEFKVTQYS